jgi:hypothetical protein
MRVLSELSEERKDPGWAEACGKENYTPVRITET